MKLFKLLAITIIYLTIASCATDEKDEKFDLNLAMHELVFNAEKKPTEISGLQMVLIKNGKIVFENAVGFARKTDNTEVPLTLDHKVRIASISKFVLTLAFMSLVEEGKVNLEEDISTYLDFNLRNPNYPDRKITSRQVLTHTSSIRDGSYYFMGLDGNFKDFFHLGSEPKSAEHYENGSHFANHPKQGPGDYFTYSNLNFGIISGIIEKVSGKRMDVFVEEKIFDPIGLTSSFNACTLYENNFDNLATLYRRGDGGITWSPNGPWVEQVDGSNISCFYESARYQRRETPDLSSLDQYQIGRNPTLFSPQGGLRASAKDLAVLMQMLMNDGTFSGAEIISKTSLDKMMTPVWQYDEGLNNGHTGGESLVGDPKSQGMMTTYGLSTHIIDLKDWGLNNDSRKLYGHLGSAYGLQGQFWFDPLTNDGIIALVTGLGQDPNLADKTTPLLAIEEAVLKIALKGLEQF